MITKNTPTCSIKCPYYLPGEVGVRSCTKGHWSERQAHRLPLLGMDAMVVTPWVCRNEQALALAKIKREPLPLHAYDKQGEMK